MSDYRLNWLGRAVMFGEFSSKVGREVHEAMKKDGQDGAFLCLAHSLRWADTGELVFASVDDVWAQPNKLTARLLYLAGEAAVVNGVFRENRLTEDGEPKPATNGHANEEPTGPSH